MPGSNVIGIEKHYRYKERACPGEVDKRLAVDQHPPIKPKDLAKRLSS
jgi:hypothetical protein